MSLLLRVKTPSNLGVLAESINIVDGVSKPLTNLEVDTNFNVLNVAIKTEETRALAAEALLAPLDSPVFTNNPTAPTLGSTYSGLGIANADYVRSYAAPIISPIFTGIVTAPTKATTDEDNTVATGAWVKNYLYNLPWSSLYDPTTTANPAIKPYADATSYIKTPAQSGVAAVLGYKGLDLGSPSNRFANIYVASGKFAANSIDIGEATLSGSTEGGVVLPTNTAIGEAENVIPANLASTGLDKAFAKANIESALKTKFILGTGITNATQSIPVGLKSNGRLATINVANVDAGIISINNFIGFVKEAGTSTNNSLVNVTISGKVDGLSGLDFGAPLATVAEATPTLSVDTTIVLNDGTESVTVPLPGVGNEWPDVATMVSSINSVITSTFAFTVTAGTGTVVFTAKSAGTLAAPTFVQTTADGNTDYTASVTVTTTGRPQTDIEVFLNTNGTLSTTSTATNTKIGLALSATEMFLYTTSSIDTYAQSNIKIDLTDLSVAANASPSGEGALAYDNTNGQFTFTPPKTITDATLIGTPTAPTAVSGTETTQIATTAFVKAAIDALIATAPGALDTLDELAQAINDDASFATSIVNTINSGLSTKANIASPTFTGTVTAPTPDSSSNDTTLATTAFVRSTSATLNNANLTGLPTAPTASAGTDTFQIATTAFVKTAVAQGGGASNMDGGVAATTRTLATHHFDGGTASG